MARLGRSQPIQAVRLAARIPAVASSGAGSGSGTWTFVGTGSGKRVAGGSGTGTWTFAGTGVGVAPIPKFATLTEAFNSADTAKWTFSNATVSGGQLNLNAPGPAGTASALTNGTYDLVGSSVSVEVVQPTSGTGSPSINVGVTPDAFATNAATFSYRPSLTNLNFVRVVSGSSTTVASVAFDPVAHRFLRLTEVSGDIAWQTSPDAETWTTRATWTPTWGIGALYYRLLESQSNGSATTGIFDNVNIIPPGEGSGTGTWTFAGTGTGTRTPKGSGSGAWSFAGAGTGARQPVGSGTGTWTFVGTGVGTLPAKGGGTGAWTFAGAGSGEHPRIGSGSGTWTFTGTGEGIAPITPSHIPGAALLTQTLGTATLATITLGTATLSNDGTSTATLTVTVGTATIDTA